MKNLQLMVGVVVELANYMHPKVRCREKPAIYTLYICMLIAYVCGKVMFLVASVRVPVWPLTFEGFDLEG